jgi:putative aldouronate transport system permease protein
VKKDKSNTDRGQVNTAGRMYNGTKAVPALRMKQYRLKKYMFLYILLAPAIILTFLFKYIPMAGIIITFQDYDIVGSFANSPFVGLDNFKKIFTFPPFQGAIFNTIKVSVIALFLTFPLPLIFAMLLNEIRNRKFKRSIQTISYLPHFLSWMSVIGIVKGLLAVHGPFNDLRILLLGEEASRIMYLSLQQMFVPNIIIMSAWKGLGWGSIIYLCALTAIDTELYEAAYMDGATKLQQALHVTLPGILPTTVMLFILKMGWIFRDNFELIYGMQNAYIDFETISTVVYKYGLQNAQYSMAAAIGFAQGIVSLVMIIGTNMVAKRTTNVSIW